MSIVPVVLYNYQVFSVSEGKTLNADTAERVTEKNI